ncbi:serine hydroxymethyltransferase [Streptomyces atratus]|jgi:glycine hydroxymethyltransferase|uniref:Serine hydroxymethyltransferase n=1 Tax=Streptomyces atratus TaxID=1893 RepID=A0A1K2B4B1_STRAR|nr:serine hydroxymethyltransferase [Streptomyces atratus]SFX93347.1 glycine hydroxymethyltransferase [Streptomyces atratus]
MVFQGLQAEHGGQPRSPLGPFLRGGADLLALEDPLLHRALTAEHQRQDTTLMMVASSSIVDPSVLACMSSAAMNVTAEGLPGARYHAGCREIDPIEQHAIERAMAVFGARFASVQAHSATTANYAVLSALLDPGDVILGMKLDQGGHLTHGYPVAYSGTYFKAVNYGLDENGRIDYAQVRELALEHRPKLIICGATAHPRTVDFARFREIADEADALLLADISHIAGLVATGLHPSPIDHAHITTTCTHKQLGGPRGALIMSGRDADSPVGKRGQPLSRRLSRAVFPYFQGAPILPAIAAKARMLSLVQGEEYRATAQRIVDNAALLAETLTELGYKVITGGTDNHIVLLDFIGSPLSGLVVERVLEDAGIVVNKNHIPGDPRPSAVTSGVRIGTNSIAQRGFGPIEMRQCARLIDSVLRAVRPLGDRDYELEEFTRQSVRTEVRKLTSQFPIPRYAPVDRWEFDE